MFPPLATIPSERDFPQRKFCLVNKTKRDRAKYEDLGDAEGKELQSVLRTWLSMRQRCELHRKKCCRQRSVTRNKASLNQRNNYVSKICCHKSSTRTLFCKNYNRFPKLK